MVKHSRVLQLDPSVPGVFRGPYPLGIDPVSVRSPVVPPGARRRGPVLAAAVLSHRPAGSRASSLLSVFSPRSSPHAVLLRAGVRAAAVVRFLHTGPPTSPVPAWHRPGFGVAVKRARHPCGPRVDLRGGFLCGKGPGLVRSPPPSLADGPVRTGPSPDPGLVLVTCVSFQGVLEDTQINAAGVLVLLASPKPVPCPALTPNFTPQAVPGCTRVSAAPAGPPPRPVPARASRSGILVPLRTDESARPFSLSFCT